MLERVPEARLEALAEAAEAYVDDTFGERLGLVPVAPTNLPHFIIDRYAIWQGSLNGRTLLLMAIKAVSYTHLRAHETVLDLVCRLLLEKKKKIHAHLLRQQL